MRGYAQHLMAKKLLATSGNHTTLARLNETPTKSKLIMDRSPMNSVTNLSNYKNFAIASQQHYQQFHHQAYSSRGGGSPTSRTQMAPLPNNLVSTDTLLSHLPMMVASGSTPPLKINQQQQDYKNASIFS